MEIKATPGCTCLWDAHTHKHKQPLPVSKYCPSFQRVLEMTSLVWGFTKQVSSSKINFESSVLLPGPPQTSCGMAARWHMDYRTESFSPIGGNAATRLGNLLSPLTTVQCANSCVCSWEVSLLPIKASIYTIWHIYYSVNLLLISKSFLAFIFLPRMMDDGQK